jgi:diketogulonate reductase-like aldo/keto reductase
MSEGERSNRAGDTFNLDSFTINRMGFGAMRLTGKGIWGEPEDPEEARAVLRRAVELGVNFIDTADSYGPKVSERLIGETLYPYPEDLVIGTKGGLVRPGPGRWKTDGRPEHLREACEGSLKRLKVERIVLYQLHRIDSSVPVEEQLGTLAELREEGKIQHVGLSEVGVEEIERAREIVPIATVQNRYSLTDRGSEDVLDFCEREGIGFIPPRRDPGAGGSRLAPRPLPGNAAYPRHLFGRAPRREPCRSRTTLKRRRVGYALLSLVTLPGEAVEDARTCGQPPPEPRTLPKANDLVARLCEVGSRRKPSSNKKRQGGNLYYRRSHSGSRFFERAHAPREAPHG